MPISEFEAAINQLADEKNLPKELVLETIEAAVAAAYRRDFGKPSQVIKAKLKEENGQFDIFKVLEVAKEVEDPEVQITKQEALKIKKGVKIGDSLEIPLAAHAEFGRIAAQTAKQVILQRLKEAERDILLSEFKDKQNEVITGTIQQIEGRNIIVDLGKTTGLLLPQDQINSEKYYPGQRLKLYLKSVEETNRGPKILLSRTDSGLVKGLFKNEVPEIAQGTVEIKEMAREAGSRSKVAVFTSQESLDPVGSAVGQRGARIQAVLADLPEEKIDIILWDKDDATFIENALSPAKIAEVKVEKKKKHAKVKVATDQLSLAIGKGGQNVRLASKLTGYNIDIEPFDKAPSTSLGTSQGKPKMEKEKKK